MVIHDARVLLTRRSDFEVWALPSGILEPGEQPGPAIVREIAEETGVRAEPIRIIGVDVTPKLRYPNGDRAQYLTVCFLLRYLDGAAHAADDENSDVDWFPVDALPEPLLESSRHSIDQAQVDEPEAWFRR